jgi:hypothetical protein
MINLQKAGKVKLASTHPVYIMKIKKKQQPKISSYHENSTINNGISLTTEEMKRIIDEIEKKSKKQCLILCYISLLFPF